MNSFLSITPTGPTGPGVTEGFFGSPINIVTGPSGPESVPSVAEIISNDFYIRSPIYITSTTSQIVIFSQILGFEQQTLETFDEEVVRIMASILSDTDILGGTPYSIYGASIADGGDPSSVYGPTEFIDGGTVV